MGAGSDLIDDLLVSEMDAVIRADRQPGVLNVDVLKPVSVLHGSVVFSGGEEYFAWLPFLVFFDHFQQRD